MSIAKRIFIEAPVGVWRFYYDGFRCMTIGKKLWTLILIKLFLLFGIMKLFFFPDILKQNYANDGERAEAVRASLIQRSDNNYNN